MLKKKFFCPVNGWDCPYCKEDLSCSMVDNGDDPVAECDDAAILWGPDEDCFIWEDENGDLFDTQDLLQAGYHFVNGEPVKPNDTPKIGMPGYWEWVKAINELRGD